MNDVELAGSLWIYAIHGRNADIIKILNDNHIEPTDDTFLECYKESVKCHHNEIAEYINNNFLQETNEINESNIENNPISFGFHYYNFKFLNDSQNLQNWNFIFYYACLYDHFAVCEYLIKTKKVDINQSIIQTSIFMQFYSTFQNQIFQ